jgi:hypothetical protein
MALTEEVYLKDKYLNVTTQLLAGKNIALV